MEREPNSKIDESLYSRQLYVLGRRAMERMTGSKVLISGMGGLGVEVAKNIVLAGIPSIVLHDSRDVQWNDLSGNFYLEPRAGGQTGCESEHRNRNIVGQAEKLRELNPNVSVEVIRDLELTSDILRQNKVTVVVLCEGFRLISRAQGSEGHLLKLADFCHEEKIPLILAETCGLFSRVFCDFGEKFVVEDPLGDEPRPVLVEKCEIDRTKGTVTCTTSESHGLQNGDVISVVSKVSADAHGTFFIKFQNSRTFDVEIKDFKDGSPPDLTSTHVIKVKIPLTMKFDRLSDSMENPKFITPDFAKPGNPIQIHSLFRALDQFIGEIGQSPQNKSEDDFQKFYKMAESILHKMENHGNAVLSDKLARQFFHGSDGQLSPMCAFIGGIVGQEVMKACTRKFQPLNQWLFYDSSECLMDEPWTGQSSDTLDKSDRYAGQIAVFGSSFQEQINNARVFVVGAGAIGCELLKNFALMGVGSGPRGKVTVTDMDSIERSNLSRQFLFRNHDVGRQKSVTAAEAVQKINPRMNIETHCLKVGAESDHVFNDQFYQDLDVIVTAVDNLSARTLMDQASIDYLKPFVDSGTHGTKGNVQVVIPNLTSNYGATLDPVTQEIPLCTLKFFPSAIEHTIQWSREMFEQEFKVMPQNSINFSQYQGSLQENGISSVDPFQSLAVTEKYSVLKEIEEFTRQTPTTFLQCVQWAWKKFVKLYVQDIEDLVRSYPIDHRNEDGGLFWANGKLFPKSLAPAFPDRDHETDTLCLDFITVAANLKASVHHIPQERDKNSILEIFRNVLPNENSPEATPLQNVEKDLDVSEDDVRELEKLLEARTLSEVSPLEFEKDDDLNLHVDFITAASNLRAKNYGIPYADRFRTKQIVGRIIPAISTTTSVVAGLVCLELYKIIQYNRHQTSLGQSRISARGPFKSAFVNLALPLVTFTFPCKPLEKSVEIRRESSSDLEDCSAANFNFNFNVWSRFAVPTANREFEGRETSFDRTLQGFLRLMKQKHFLQVTSISYGEILLYADFLGDENEPFMNLPLEQVVAQLSENENILRGKTSLKLNICCDNVKGGGEGVEEGADLPPVFYHLQ